MSPTALQDIEAAALKLSDGERYELLERLAASLPQSGLDADWEAEVERRLAAFDAGEAKAVPAEEVFARLDETFKIRRP